MVSLGGAAGMGGGKKSSDKKVCLWPLANNTTCGKAFSKSESLKRHLAEVHKGKNAKNVCSLISAANRGAALYFLSVCPSEYS